MPSPCSPSPTNCAHAAGRDSLEYLLALIGPPRIVDVKKSAPDYPNYGGSLEDYPIDTARLRRVIELAAEKSGWGKRKLGKGQGMGIAVHRSFLTYVAEVVQVEVNDQGELSIPRVDIAVDAGLVVNPEATRSQFEGAAVFGTSLARFGEITATNGAVDQSNFDSYPVARMNEAPVPDQRLHRRKRRAAGGCRRTWRSAVRAGTVQRDLRGYGKTCPRVAAIEDKTGHVVMSAWFLKVDAPEQDREEESRVLQREPAGGLRRTRRQSR